MGGYAVTDDPTTRLPPPNGPAPGAAARAPSRLTRAPLANWELSRPTRRWLLTLVGALLVGAAGSAVSVPYVVYQPGSAFNALGPVPGGQAPMIAVTGAPTYAADGALDVTTVALYGGPGYELNVWDWVRFKVAGAEFVDRDQVYPPNVTKDQVNQLNRADMVGSQQEAVAVALRATGRKVTEQTVVGGVLQDSPAAGRLREGDVLTAVNGTPIAYATDVARLLQRTADGSPARLGILRRGVASTVSVTPVTADGRRRLRVQLGNRFTFPFEVKINAGEVGGPSAGLIFSLAVYDKLTPGSLTGGRRIAGTGTIGSDGVVGPIGGIEHKLVGAREAGAQWFLAPSANCTGVAGRVPDGLRVVKVGTFAQAKSAVEQIAAGRGEALAGC